jgi:hypothetical protein
MQNAMRRADDGFGTIVSNLISLVEHVQASIANQPYRAAKWHGSVETVVRRFRTGWCITAS